MVSTIFYYFMYKINNKIILKKKIIGKNINKNNCTGIPSLQGVGNMQIQYSNGSNSYFKRANFTFSKEFKLFAIL